MNKANLIDTTREEYTYYEYLADGLGVRDYWGGESVLWVNL